MTLILSWNVPAFSPMRRQRAPIQVWTAREAERAVAARERHARRRQRHAGRRLRRLDRLTVSHRAASLFRSSLASVVLLELYERLEINHWLYTDDGAFPRWAVMPPADVAPTLHWLCVHAWDDGHEWVTGLAALQGVVALFLLSGALPPPYRPHERWLRTSAAICWALQLSLMLRNPQLVFILDRYLHILLLLAACMPSGSRGGAGRCSAGSCALGVQLLVIYLDAGWGLS